MEIKVTVIIPIYNVENYIEECLVSVINQTLKEIEIICINDGTKDNSMKVVEEYAKNDERILILDKENGGLSSARNAGLRAARGEYVYFIDSDDYVELNMLEILYKEVIDNNLDNIYFDATSFFETEELARQQENYIDYYRRESIYTEVKTGLELLASMEKNKHFRPSACLQMPKRSLLIENNIDFYEGIIHEDNLFSLKCIVFEKRVKHISMPFYQRRIREDSIMTSAKEIKSSYGYFICVIEFLKLIDNLEINDEVKEALFKRLKVIQGNAVNIIKSIQAEEYEKFIYKEKLNVQLQYELLIKNFADYKFSAEKNINGKKELIEKKNSQIKSLNLKIKEKEKEIVNIRNSSSYRVGLIVTYFPRKIKSLVRMLKNNGVKYTLYNIEKRIRKNKIYVSIIIPMYNAEKYLKRCLNTILEQNLKNIEIICVDDGSIDKTCEILEEYTRKDSRIKVYHQENSGAGIARNLGLSHAQGEYVLFLDADDIFMPTLCDDAYYKCRLDNADICLYGAERYNMQTLKLEPMGWVLRTNSLPDNIPFSAKDTNGKMYQLTTGCPWSKMFNREFILKNNIQFQDTKNANDVLFVRTALAIADRITVLDKTLVHYRYNDGSNTQSLKALAPLEFYKAFRALKQELISRGVYKDMEQTYVNMVLTESLFNLKTAGTQEAVQKVNKTLLEEGFEFFEFDKFDESYFYNKEEYQEYVKIKNIDNVNGFL